jgi:CTP:molybdopterin cytidylyltransferase MocA/HD superfamily phosphohydrolase YqeK
MVEAIIPAAGLSRRMGEFKPLLDLRGKSVLAWSVDLFRAAGIERIHVVTGHRSTAVAQKCVELGAEPVHNPDYESGMFSSVRAGVQALSRDCLGFFVHPVDIPLVRPWSIERMQSLFLEHQPPLVYPCFLGQRGHPPLLSAEIAGSVRAHEGSGGLRRVLSRFENEAVHAELFDRNILLDMDTGQDRERLLRRAGRLERIDREEAEALLRHVAPISAEGRTHGLAVARIAEAIATALNASGSALDVELTFAAGLVHDIAKGEPGHEQAGGAMLRAMGLADVASIVAAHRDISLAPDAPLTEREAVYLADKLVRGRKRISIEERFQEKIDLFAHDPEATAAIRHRLANATAMRSRMEERIGRPLEDVLPDLEDA